MITNSKLTVNDKFQIRLDAWKKKCEHYARIHNILYMLNQELIALQIDTALKGPQTLSRDLLKITKNLSQYI